MKHPVLEPKHQQMLELLAEGASTRTIAKKMGYSDGTVRVYLHNLYKKLGVKNRTEALLWQLDRTRGPASVAEAPPRPLRANESFGEVALRDGLLGALGIMESFTGPFGRLWEVGVQLKGTDLNAASLVARDDARLLWRAMLQGSFSHAKALYDEGHAEGWLEEAAPHAVLVTGMLLLGGYTHAADRCFSTLSKSRKSGRSAAREIALLRGVREAIYSSGLAAMSSMHQAAVDKGANPVVRQLAMVLLFHAHRLRKDSDGARETANAIWSEAENARRQMEAMGVRPLGRDVSIPRPGKAMQRRAKVTAEV
jgi:DNA-binding CsgD family transcriptional regulator